MKPSLIEPAHPHPAPSAFGHRAGPARSASPARPARPAWSTDHAPTSSARPVATLPNDAPGTTIEHPVIDPVDETIVVPDRPWLVVVWNDPVNLMSFVT